MIAIQKIIYERKNMTYDYHDTTNDNALSYDYRQEIVDLTIYKIKQNDELMERIRNHEILEMAEVKSGLTLEERVEMKVQELADKVLDK